MGSKDKQWREKKKPKKGDVKLTNQVLMAPVEVEVAKKKGKKPPEFPEET